MSLARRLVALEKSTAVSRSSEDVRQRYAAEHQVRLEVSWQIMQSTMGEAHARLVVEAFNAEDREAIYDTPGGRLLRRCLDAITAARYRQPPYNEITDQVALAMPPVVAEIYMADAHALPLHDCEECGFQVPISSPLSGQPARLYFERCPLCGGRVGYTAFWLKHSGAPDRAV